MDNAANVEGWLSRTQSPSVTSGSSTEGWLQNGATPQKATNGNSTMQSIDPWLTKSEPPSIAPPSDPWLGKSSVLDDPWQTTGGLNSNKNDFDSAPISSDPWAPIANIGVR